MPNAFLPWMKHTLVSQTVILLCTTCLQPIFHELDTYIFFLEAYVVGQKVSQKPGVMGSQPFMWCSISALFYETAFKVQRGE